MHKSQVVHYCSKLLWTGGGGVAHITPNGDAEWSGILLKYKFNQVIP